MTSRDGQHGNPAGTRLRHSRDGGNDVVSPGRQRVVAAAVSSNASTNNPNIPPSSSSRPVAGSSIPIEESRQQQRAAAANTGLSRAAGGNDSSSPSLGAAFSSSSPSGGRSVVFQDLPPSAQRDAARAHVVVVGTSSSSTSSPHNGLSRRRLLSRLRSASAPASSGTFSLPHLPQRSRSRSRAGAGAGGDAMEEEMVELGGGGAQAVAVPSAAVADKNASLQAQIEKEDSMIYLDGPQVYTCGNCRTHLTSHDDIISKSFHGRHGRAYLFDQCVNVSSGPKEDRLLMTGMHSVCDIYCNRCKQMVGWTYAKAYEPSQKYKEGKFIIEKINLHMEESIYGIGHPAGERGDKWRMRSMSWGSSSNNEERHHRHHGRWDRHDNEDDGRCSDSIVYEYGVAVGRQRSVSFGGHQSPPSSIPPSSPQASRPRKTVRSGAPVSPAGVRGTMQGPPP